jgi:hypothetical protein
MNVAGRVETLLFDDAFARTFAHGEWRANVGRHAIRLSGPLGECKFVRIEDGYPLDGGIDAENVMAAARSLSAQLTGQRLPHQLEVYDASGKLVLYLHHDRPLEA